MKPAEYQALAAELDLARNLLERASLEPWGERLVHIPNEQASKRLRIEGAQTGVRPGYPDYRLDLARGGWFGAAFELKRAGKRPTAAQLWWLDTLAGEGYLTWWADDWECAFGRLDWYASLEPTLICSRQTPPWET